MKKLIAVLMLVSALALTAAGTTDDVTAGDHPCMACW